MKLQEAYTARGSQKMPDFELDRRLLAPELYIPSRELKDTVNVAIWLGKPLLLTGEPGTGKTQLAFSVALNFKLVNRSDLMSGQRQWLQTYSINMMLSGIFSTIRTRETTN